MLMLIRDQVYRWSLLNQDLFQFLKIVGLLLSSALLFVITRLVLIRYLHRTVDKTETQWDNVLLKHKVFHTLAYLAPAALLYYGAELFPSYVEMLRRFIYLFILLNIILLIDRVLEAVDEIYNTLPIADTRNIQGYLQPLKLFVYSGGALIAIAVLLNKPLFTILSSIGALTAVLLLLFRDTLLSMLASIRISTNDLFREGDWIEMSQYGADGEVIKISLHHVQIQNWDMTLVMVPTSKFIEDTFKNWKGIHQAGGRRIKRAVHIDQTSVQFCDPAMLASFRQIDLLRDLLDEEEARLQALNKKTPAIGDSPINQVQLTNLGVFRKYVRAYLKAHPGIHHGLPLMVRLLEPGAKGIGIEIYTFTNGTAWIHYESIQAEIFDHLLASLSLFHLRIFQEASGHDVRAAFV